MRYAVDSKESVPSLEDLLDEAERARSDGADIVEVVSDPKDGHPTSVKIDYDEKAIDDEACYTVTDYSENHHCAGLCISDATVELGEEVTIVFAPPKKQIWGVSAEIRADAGSKRIAWLSGDRDDRTLKTVWPGPNIGFRDIGFYGRAEWSWTAPARLEPGAYEISKESIRIGSAPIEDRIRTWVVSFEVIDPP